MSGNYISIADFSRKYKCNALLLRTLINKHNFKPDVTIDNVPQFTEERLHLILNILLNNYSR